MRSLFTRLAGDEAETRLNYIWLCREPFNALEAGVPCGVPLQKIDLALGNAFLYPAAAVDLWLDYDHLDHASVTLTRLHAAIAPNVTVKDINEIPAYRRQKTGVFNPDRNLEEICDLSVFEPFERHNIWGRVDYARLLVLDHCLRCSNARDVVYADFDVTDVSLDKPSVQSRLDRHGMAFPLNPNGAPENGYMAFRRDKLDQDLFARLLAETENDVTTCRNGPNGFNAFYRTIEAWSRARGLIPMTESLFTPLVGHMRQVTDRPEQYKSLCVP